MNRTAEVATAGASRRRYGVVRRLVAGLLAAIPIVAVRAGAWACVVVIAYLSLVPHNMEIRTPLPGGLEHAIAYAGAGALMKLGYPRRTFWLIASGFFAYSSVLEVLQAFVPGRHSEIEGALWSGSGALLGACATAYLFRWTGSTFRPVRSK